MKTLLLRLEGPLQSWGTGSRFEVRQTVFNGLANWHQLKRLALLQKKGQVESGQGAVENKKRLLSGQQGKGQERAFLCRK